MTAHLVKAGFGGARRRAARVLACSLIAASLGACGFIDGSGGLYDPNAAAAAAPAPAAAEVVETMAPQAAAAASVSRAQGVVPSAASATTSNATPSTSAPSTSAAATPGATVNTVDTIVSDMRLMNDMVLRGYESRTVGWYVGPGYNQMGNIPKSSNTANWFKNAYPYFINDNDMRAVLPWLVLFDGVGHAATNTRVQMRNLRAYYKSRRTGQWLSYGMTPGVSGFGTSKSDLFGGSMPEDKRTNADGSVEVKPPANTNYAWHGWWDRGRVSIDPTDIAAVYVTMQARLVVDDTSQSDDRGAARLLIQIGADYYPDTGSGWPGANPAVATSRAKRITNGWQSYNMMTFTDVGFQDPGGGISEAAFRAAPPPLE